MDLEFSLTKMKDVLEESLKQTDKYSEAIDIIDKNITELEDKMQTDETKIYISLVNKYKENKKLLVSLKEEMKKFCINLEKQINSLEDKTTSIKKDFE